MGKDKKTKKRSVGLTEDILESKTVKPSGRLKQRRERQGESDDTVRSWSGSGNYQTLRAQGR